MSHESKEMTDFLNGGALETMKMGPALRHYHKLAAEGCASEAMSVLKKSFKDQLKAAVSELKEEHAAELAELKAQLKGLLDSVVAQAKENAKKEDKD